MRTFLAVAAVVVWTSLPARAEPPAALTPDALLGGIVQESDVSLAFSYLREALKAAMQGREARPPYELQRRADAIADELRRRGAIAGEALLEEIERNVREELRSRPRIPPSDYRQRI